MMQLANTWILYLLWVVPLLGFVGHVLRRRRRNGLRRFANPALHPHPVTPVGRFRWIWQSALVLTGLFLALFALARPQWGVREELVSTRGRDLIVALDVSRSMLARDVFPSRLGRAKVDLLDLVRTLRGDRVGLIAFRGKASLLCPLTTDYGFFTEILDGVGIDSAPVGETNIGDALRKALEAFGADPGAHKAIVLISDGEDLAGGLDTAIEEAHRQGIAIFTVGLGDPAGAPIPQSEDHREPLKFEGQAVVSKLHHETLRRIAEATGGAYVPIALAHVDLGILYRDHLSRISAQEREETLQRAQIERYQYFLLPAWLCFLAVGLLSCGHRLRRNPPRLPPIPNRQTLSLAILLLAASPLFAGPTNAPAPPPGRLPPESPAPVSNIPPGRAGARKAQTLYTLHQYDQSAATYLEAARGGPPSLQATLLYNAACALYQAGRNEEAAELFRTLYSRDKAPLADAAFNRGVALHQASLHPSTNAPDSSRLSEEIRADLLTDSAEAFQRALRTQRDSQPARNSLAAVQALLPEATEQAHISRVLKNEGQTSPSALADRLLNSQRQINTAIPLAHTNAIPERIRALERLAADQKANTDLLIPLKSQLIEALSKQSANATNRPVRPEEVAHFIEVTRDQLNRTAQELRDLDPHAASSGKGAEAALYTLWKGIADYPQLLQEDIRQQSNVVTVTARGLDSLPSADFTALVQNQFDAGTLTHLFLDRFQASVPKEGIPAPPAQTSKGAGAKPSSTSAPDTNAPPLLTAENRQKIVDLAHLAIDVQSNAVETLRDRETQKSLTRTRHASDLLKEIEKLLPHQSQPQSSQQPQNQPQSQKKDQPKESSEKQPPEQSQKPQPKPEEEPQKPQTPKDIEQLLNLARQREKDYQDSQRRRNSDIPMPPMTRDW